MKTTITTTVAHGVSRGDVVSMGGERFVVVSVKDTTFTLGPVPWWRRIGRAVVATWQWLARKVWSK